MTIAEAFSSLGECLNYHLMTLVLVGLQVCVLFVGDKDQAYNTPTALFKGRTVAVKKVASRSLLTKEELQDLKAVMTRL